MEIIYDTVLPEKDAFFALYESTGWNSKGLYTMDVLFNAIQNSWFLISAFENGQLVGFGRIISDGYYQTFIGDLIVHPEYQGKGIGRHILNLLVDKCKASNIKWIQLTCAKGKSPFYKKFGFEERPSEGPGMQMYL